MGHSGACHSRLVAAALLIGACGGRDALSEPGVPRTNAPAIAADAYCNGFGACCANRGFEFDAAGCKTRLSASLTADGICPTTSDYDPIAAAQCYAELTAALSSCSPGVPEGDLACNRMCRGTKAAGSSCSHLNECAAPSNGTAVCAYIKGAAMGTCLTQTLLALGDACNETCTDPGINGSTCIVADRSSTADSVVLEARVCSKNLGLYCSTDLTCKAVMTIGGPCLDVQCEMGTHCSQSTYVCVADYAAGGACPAGNECARGTYCGADRVCATKKAEGEPCQANTECKGVCDATGHCLGGDSPELNVTAASCTGSTQ